MSSNSHDCMAVCLNLTNPVLFITWCRLSAILLYYYNYNYTITILSHDTIGMSAKAIETCDWSGGGASALIRHYSNLSLSRLPLCPDSGTKERHHYVTHEYVVVMWWSWCPLCVVPPSISLFYPGRSSIDIRAGDTLQLDCRATGRPPPTVIWTHRVLINFISVAPLWIRSGQNNLQTWWRCFCIVNEYMNAFILDCKANTNWLTRTNEIWVSK